MKYSKLFSLRVFYLTLIISTIVLYTVSVTVFDAKTVIIADPVSTSKPVVDVEPVFKAKTDQKIEVNGTDCLQSTNNPNNDGHDGILDDISNSTVKPVHGRSIFFLMTKNSGKDVSLLAGQSCAIESAAFRHPNRNVFVLFASPVKFATETQSATLAVLRSYTNIHFMNMNLDTFVKGTPAEDFYRSGRIFSSTHLVEHMSDFLRLLVLYKYGGIYLDTDAIVQKNMDGLPANFLGKEAYAGTKINGINGAVIGFQDQDGHEILELCLNDLITNFNSTGWNQNGPALLTRVLVNKVCHTSLAEMTPEKCRGLKVFPPEEFYAINYDDWPYFLDVRHTEFVLEATSNSSVVHLWNHFWRKKMITKSKSKLRTAYEAIAEKDCPKVFITSGDYF
ncbi:lactosylceramide 4-alpha-galactosyltransferase-like [Sitodiplosis mosellana]|uniref:lactosylceramide 4-alpha-galactosyltransferase-like n=1 Tax=Sitodiplosis mosellana TaxID=263140 RepID=UPI0024449125|nr:lactosylceramide 4-alpha-galactosyltransferase-like [Sitodiplosis mosellana]XP_055297543.1 lactosylceramide 4-alpha-galactosyltransferase-like [Sitodiplosis mosellana]XP_055297544.1 lactosylceramide 4-alpha-galactosyltransferase-like [Sitodiplosis mosellana]